MAKSKELINIYPGDAGPSESQLQWLAHWTVEGFHMETISKPNKQTAKLAIQTLLFLVLGFLHLRGRQLVYFFLSRKTVASRPRIFQCRSFMLPFMLYIPRESVAFVAFQRRSMSASLLACLPVRLLSQSSGQGGKRGAALASALSSPSA